MRTSSRMWPLPLEIPMEVKTSRVLCVWLLKASEMVSSNENLSSWGHRGRSSDLVRHALVAGASGFT